jgi:chitinase
MDGYSGKLYSRFTALKKGFDNKNDPDKDNGLKDNPCQPFGQNDAEGDLIDNRGFALLNEDNWFNRTCSNGTHSWIEGFPSLETR